LHRLKNKLSHNANGNATEKSQISVSGFDQPFGTEIVYCPTFYAVVTSN